MFSKVFDWLELLYYNKTTKGEEKSGFIDPIQTIYLYRLFLLRFYSVKIIPFHFSVDFMTNRCLIKLYLDSVEFHIHTNCVNETKSKKPPSPLHKG